MKTEQSDAVQQEIRIEAKPETIFEYFTDPEKMLRWRGSRRRWSRGRGARTA